MLMTDAEGRKKEANKHMLLSHTQIRYNVCYVLCTELVKTICYTCYCLQVYIVTHCILEGAAKMYCLVEEPVTTHPLH